MGAEVAAEEYELGRDSEKSRAVGLVQGLEAGELGLWHL